MKKITIIYVEDSWADISIMEYILRLYKDEVDLLTFQDGEQFIKFIEDRQRSKIPDPVYIFLDINLPIFNGFQILEYIKTSKDPEIRNMMVIMYSSSMHKQDEEKSKKLGANEYIQKPQTYDSTKAVIEDLLKKSDLVPEQALGVANVCEQM